MSHAVSISVTRVFAITSFLRVRCGDRGLGGGVQAFVIRKGR